MSESLKTDLSKVLASLYTLQLKTQNFHWNVEGPLFYSLHMLFEQQYTAIAMSVDEVAERLRAMNERAPGSYSEFSKLSILEDAPAQKIPAQEMIEILTKDHGKLAQLAAKVQEQADKIDDKATTSMMDGLITFHEKSAWMIRSHGR